MSNPNILNFQRLNEVKKPGSTLNHQTMFQIEQTSNELQRIKNCKL